MISAHNALYVCITSSAPSGQKRLHLPDIYHHYSSPCAAFICQCSSVSLFRFLLLLLSLGLSWTGLNWRAPLGIGYCALPPPTHVAYSLSSIGLCAQSVKNSGQTISGINRLINLIVNAIQICNYGNLGAFASKS